MAAVGGAQDAVISFFSKGSGDISFSGAVDQIRINNELYDFEPLGVVRTAVSAP